MKLRSLFGVICAALLLAAPAVASAAPTSRGPRHTIGRGTSTNWSGYAVDGSNATTVTGTWTQPVVKCAARENSWSSPWVGIDGDTDNTVEQTGTDSDCVNGAPYYYAWYEMYPKSTVIAPLAVAPGDSITGTVTYAAAGSFTLSLKDNSTGATFTTTQSSKKAAARSSAEWIVEGPSNGLLSDFGSVAFSRASAIINGQSASLGGLAGAHPITMETAAVRATPSAISGGNAFTDTWEHS